MDHSAGVQENGTLWTWGRNFGITGNLIYTATNILRVPTQVGVNTNWAAVDAGYDHSLAIDRARNMFAWGGNDIGQLGNGAAGTSGSTNGQNRAIPVQIGAQLEGRTWLAVDAGMKHSLALANDGTIWAWGWNNLGQVGNGTVENQILPVQLQFTNLTGVITNLPVVPTISTQSTSQIIPMGSNTTLFVTAEGAPLLSYQWRFNTTNVLAGGTNSTFEIANAQSANAGSYSVVVTNTFGSVTSSAIVLTISNAAPVITQQPTNRTVIEGSTAIFTVVASGASPLRFEWRFNNMTVTNGIATNASLTLSNVQESPLWEGYYTVVITNSFGSITSNPALLDVTTNAGTNIEPPFQSPGAAMFQQPFTLLPVYLATNSVIVPVQSTSTRLFIIEYKESLSDTDWTPLSTNQGNGGVNWRS